MIASLEASWCPYSVHRALACALPILSLTLDLEPQLPSQSRNALHAADDMTDSLRTHLTRLIAYAESADVTLQQEVAEKLANEAVKSERQRQIVEVGGLKLLLPLTKSTDMEVRRVGALCCRCERPLFCIASDQASENAKLAVSSSPPTSTPSLALSQVGRSRLGKP